VSTDSTGHTTSGVVQSIQLGSSTSGGQPQILINGTPYNLSQVLSVSPTPTTPATSSTTSSTSTTSSPTTN